MLDGQKILPPIPVDAVQLRHNRLVGINDAWCGTYAYAFLGDLGIKYNDLLKVRACLAHALEMGHFTPGGSTEGWAKEVLEITKWADEK